MKTAVINNREALVQGQMQPKDRAVGRDGQKTGPLMLGKIVTLLPGVNFVDSADLEALRKNPAFEMQFSTKIPPSLAPEQNPEQVGKPILVVVETKDKDGKRRPLEVEDNQPLAKLTAEQCKLLISETHVESFLHQWTNEETRPDIRFEIAKRLEEIGGKPVTAASAGR